MPEEAIPSPYVGLRPFGEADRAYFFGRERESRVVTANVLEERLTVLYGPSGAGKSSILQAGVIPLLKSASDRVVYFRNWQTDSFLHELIQVCSAAASTTATVGNGRLEDIAGSPSSRLYLLLDQFEEYLLYHSGDGGGDSGQPEANSFDSTLARLVNRQDSGVNVLIGIREDQISKLDQRFNIRIRDLFGNTLPIQRLDIESAKDAIRKPLGVFNGRPPAVGRTFEIEDELVEAILQQTRAGQTAASESSGKGESQAAKSANYVETAYLELVLSEVWRCEWRNGSTTLRYRTLSEMGGASSIVRNHVNVVMNNLPSDHHREIAACMFQYLVTPSRTKIAQRTEDLILFAEAAPNDVRSVLNELTDKPETRILRRLPSPEQYEIFHDVLAEHILEWRRNRESQKREVALQKQHAAEAAKKQRELEQAQVLAEEQRRRAEAEAAAATQAQALEKAQRDRADEQAAAARKLRKTVKSLRWLTAIAAILAVSAMIAAFLAFKFAKEEKRLQSQAAEESKRASEYLSEANDARKKGDLARAASLEKDAQNALTQSQLAAAEKQQRDQEEKFKNGLAGFSLKQVDAENAIKERDQFKALLASAQDENKKLTAQLAAANDSTRKLGEQLTTSEKEVSAFKNREEVADFTWTASRPAKSPSVDRSRFFEVEVAIHNISSDVISPQQIAYLAIAGGIQHCNRFGPTLQIEPGAQIVLGYVCPIWNENWTAGTFLRTATGQEIQQRGELWVEFDRPGKVGSSSQTIKRRGKVIDFHPVR
jgi:hypothetical protein